MPRGRLSGVRPASPAQPGGQRGPIKKRGCITGVYRIFFVIALLAPLLAAGAPGCQKSEPDAASTLERIRQTGVIKVGYANEAPYAYLDNENGRLTGEAPEIIRALMKDLGAERIDGVLTEFGSLIPGLKAGRFDVIAAGMYIKPERCREIAFTNPTYKIGESFLVAAGNPLGLHSYEDVSKITEARLGVVAGAVELGYAKATGTPMERITVLPDAPSAVSALLAGRIDAYGGTSLTVSDLFGKTASDSIEIAKPFRDPVIDGKKITGYGAFGVRKEDGALLAELNRLLKTFIGSERHRQTVGPFGFTELQLPGGMTAEKLCGGQV